MRYIKVTLYVLFALFVQNVNGQQSLPYLNSFDSPSDTTGWVHYAITGSDDWEMGVPQSSFFTAAYSLPGAWVTDLDAKYQPFSNRVLVTPSFDLSDVSKNYALSFCNKHSSNGDGTYFYVEYSLDNGNTWLLLDNASAKKKYWQGKYGFNGNTSFTFRQAAISLFFLQGQSNVKFRFRVISELSNGDGWLVDDFSVAEEYFNIYATTGNPIRISQNMNSISVESLLGYQNQYVSNTLNTTNYYLSTDAILDQGDVFLGSKALSIYESVSKFSQTLNLPSNLNARKYYLLYKHDALNVLKEQNEIDNVGYAILTVDSTHNVPYGTDFESSIEPWRAYLRYEDSQFFWALGKGYSSHLEGAHSANNAWHTCKSVFFDKSGCTYNCNQQYVESPSLDLTTDTGNVVFNMWYKLESTSHASLEYSVNNGINWSFLYELPLCREDDWDFINVSLNAFSSNKYIKFRVAYSNSYWGSEGIVFDDVYIGHVKPDLSIERDRSNYYTPTTSPETTIKYFLCNSGPAPVTNTITKFYWSIDSVFDVSDPLLGVVAEKALNGSESIWTEFSFVKPDLSPGKYYVFYVLDADGTVNEMREYDNTGCFVVYQNDIVSVPYFNDFETQINNWRHNASLGSDYWQWTKPNGLVFNDAFSGEKAWVTKSMGVVSPLNRMHLYTPIFDLSTTVSPVLQFDMSYKTSSSSLFHRGLNMSYSVDGGATWTVLDTTNNSFNRWYYTTENIMGIDRVGDANRVELLFDKNERAFVSIDQYNGRDVNRNSRYNIALTSLAGVPHVQFRFNLADIPRDSVALDVADGCALIDDFSIDEANVDLTVDYKKALMLSSFSDKVKFFMHIKNQGNYISSKSTVDYYLSADTVLGSSDFSLGQISLPAIRPDMYHYVNVLFNSPSDFSDYRYLIYRLDSSNDNIEINESNNEGYWELALDSVKTYPYFNDFNNPVVDGWHQYTVDPYYTNFRFRNTMAPTEQYHRPSLRAGEWSTEFIDRYLGNYPPYLYLESPAFNFKAVDRVMLSFDFLCTGLQHVNSFDGGNLQFSRDGGRSWIVLTSQYGQAVNWFNCPILHNVDNEPGWSQIPTDTDVSKLSPASIDLSSLKGSDNIIFRFKYKSRMEFFGPGTALGMKVDNFKVEGYCVDYIVDDSLDDPIGISPTHPEIPVNYTITNTGQITGKATKTKFFWSQDTVLDWDDILIHSVNESPLAADNSINESTIVTCPSSLLQSAFYLFYMADGDSLIVEPDENNNVGMLKVVLDITLDDKNILTNKAEMSVLNDKLSVNLPPELVLNAYTLSVVNVSGQIVCRQSDLFLSQGLNTLSLPCNLSNGLYQIVLQNKTCSLSIKHFVRNVNSNEMK